MKNIFKITIATFLLTAFASCDLDRYPDSAVPEDKAMTTPSEAQQIVFGTYSAFKNAALYSGKMALGPDLQADLAYAIEGYTNTYGELYRWIAKSTNAEVEDVYSGLYQIIARCNFFMDKIGPIEEKYTSESDKETIRKCKGDIYFMRALAYSELIRLYCKAYDPKTAENDLGVSIVTSYVDRSKKPLRSNLKKSYEQVIEDLTQAEKIVKREGNSSPYITKGAVNALYARVYLYMQEWQKAVDYATKLIEDTNYSLQSVSYSTLGSTYNDYRHMWVYDEGPEVIWLIGMSYTDRGGALGTEFLGSKTAMNQYLPDYIPAQWVLDLYDSGDQRYNAFFLQKQTSYSHGLVWPLLIKYNGNPVIDNGGRPLLTNQPKVFRLSEQYLIRAEAYYHLSGVENERKANEDITALRRARITNYGSSAASGDQLLKEIQNERVRELYMEGFRLTDLKRWGLGFQRKAQSHTIEGPNRLRVDKSNPLFTWPIPKHEMDAVAGMQPNESND